MPFRSAKDRVVLVAVEPTYASPPTMNAATAVLAMNATIRTAADQLAREIDRPHFGGDPFVLVGKRAELEFECDVIGSATVGNAAPLSAVYRGCGHAEVLTPSTSAQYSPVSQNQASVTIDFYWAGVRFRLLGARGSMAFETQIKQYAKARCRFVGLLTIPSDQNPPTGIDLSAFQTPPPVEEPTWTLTIGTYAAHATSFSLDQGGETPLIETSETRQVIWTDRKPSGSLIVVKNDALSTWNPWQLADQHSVVTITSTINGGAGKTTTITCRAQLGYPEPTDVEGVAALQIPFTCVPDLGDDEYSITFT